MNKVPAPHSEADRHKKRRKSATIQGNYRVQLRKKAIAGYKNPVFVPVCPNNSFFRQIQKHEGNHADH